MLSAHRERHRRVVMMAGFKNRQSYLFDGVNEYININNVLTNSLATTTTGTWSCWVKPVDATPTVAAYMIAFGDTDAISDLNLEIQANGTVRLFLRIASTVQFVLETTNAVLSDLTWTHIAAVQDAVSPVLYINGIAVAQTFTVSTVLTTWFNDATALDNGRLACRNLNNNGNINFINGNIDEVGIFNTNLSSSQILEIYNNGKPKNLLKHSANANLVSYFRFDGDPFDGTNFSVRDKKGNNHGATVNMEYADLEFDVP